MEQDLSTAQLLEDALQHALPAHPAPRRTFKTTARRTLTRRGVLWLGQTCNLRCQFCYFLDRIGDAAHPEHAFMPLEKAKRICRTLVDVYGNSAVDLQGGEPTIWRSSLELVRYCREIGLYPTLITNGLVLAQNKRCQEYKDAGVRDFLVSVQGLGPVHDEIVGTPGAHLKQMKALGNLAELGTPFRFNCVLSKRAIPQLPSIARLAVRSGAHVVNFIAFNPFEDQLKPGRRSTDNVPRYTDVRGRLEEALDILAEAGLEANVRYFPFCMLPERHWPSNYNFKQLPYDHHEWDYASWTWTQETSQRTAAGDLSKPPRLERQLHFGPLHRWARWLLAERPRLRAALRRGREHASRLLLPTTSKEDLYGDNATLRSTSHCGYRRAAACGRCDLAAICDGFHGDYAEMFGTDEAKSVRLSQAVSDPTFFIGRQLKIVEIEDEAWALKP